MRPARNYTYLMYENYIEGDCVPSSYDHCIHAMTGTPPTDPSQQKTVKATNSANGTLVGWFMWKMFLRRANHFRQKCFGTIGISQSQFDWALNRYGAFMACVDGGLHEVAVIDNDATNYYVVALTVAGKVEAVERTAFVAMCQRGTFAFTNTFDPLLLGNAFVHNLFQPLIWLILVSLGLYATGVI